MSPPPFVLPKSSPPNCGTLPPDECSPPPVLSTPPSYPLLPPPPPSPTSAASHGRSTFVTALIVAGSVLAFLALCLSAFLFVRRMRQRRRRREALLEAAALSPAAPPGDGGVEEVVHHAWHIRTVGLDEAAIESIALTRYRAPGVVGGAASDDCTVCLGEFQDGELLRLLPQCAHAFHVQCIDTWLRAHVSCPLCRATVMVMDPAAAAAAEQHDDPAPPGAGDDDAEQEQDAGTPEHEQPVQHAGELTQIEQRDQESSLPERPHRHPIPRAQNFRRVASMDSPLPIVSAVEAREHGGAKQGTRDAVCCEVSPGSDHLNRAAMKRSLSAGSRWTLLSRHRRTRTSLLPL